jgi:hypothetical protein
MLNHYDVIERMYMNYVHSSFAILFGEATAIDVPLDRLGHIW